jgi:hypothetical protein
MVIKETDPFGFSEGAKIALEQTHQAMDTYGLHPVPKTPS